MNRLIAGLALVTLAGCIEQLESAEPKSDGTPGGIECEEFTRKTTHSGKPVKCRILWCRQGRYMNSAIGGASTLWCDEAPAKATP